MSDGPDLLPAGVYEALARAIHENYVRRQKEEGKNLDSNPSMVDWGKLPETLRESNRDQAHHIAVKLGAVGRRIEPLAAGTAETVTFSSEEVELMAEMEHERWVQERAASGWTLGREKEMEARKTPYLVSWHELPEDVKQYDRDTVVGMPAFLSTAGFRIVRLARKPSDG